MRKRRIRREIVRVEESTEDDELDEEDEDIEADIDDEYDDDEQTQIEREDDEEADDEDEDDEKDEAENEAQPSKSIWRHIVTGGFITSDGATQYYRYLIAIAIMCFISIFLTFMSLNADSEYRRKGVWIHGITPEGEKFTVCDPTYIGARVGRTMPDMDNAEAEIILLDARQSEKNGI